MAHLYDVYAPVLMGIIFKIIASKEVAALVLKKTFIIVSAKLDEVEAQEDHATFAWMLRIAREEAVKVLPDISKRNASGCTQIYQLTFLKGYSLNQAAEKVGMTRDEARKCLRTELQHTDKL